MPLTYNAKIRLKRGYGDPSTSLELGEPGLDLSTNTLYVGKGNTSNAIQIASYTDISTLINDISSNSYNYLKESSLGSDFVWENGELGVNTEITDVNYIKFNTEDPSLEHLQGVVHWSNENTLEVDTGVDNVRIQLGLEGLINVYNNSGETIPNGTPVIGVSDPSIEGYLCIEKAIANSEVIKDLMGITTHDVEDGSIGFVTKRGKVRNLNTSQWSNGDRLYISPYNAGEFTNVKPLANQYPINIAKVIKTHTTDGIIELNSLTLDADFQKVFEYLKTPYGFLNKRQDSSIGVSGSTFYLTPTDGSINVYIKSVYYNLPDLSININTGVEGFHYIILDASGSDVQLQELYSLDEFDSIDNCRVAITYWSTVEGRFIYLNDQRHGPFMSIDTKKHILQTDGLKYVEGLTPYDFSIGPLNTDPTSDAEAQLSLTAGSSYETDLRIDVSNNFPQQFESLYAPIYYFYGPGVFRKDDPSSFICKSYVGGDGRLAYNKYDSSTGLWSQQEVQEEYFVNSHLLIANDINYPIVVSQGLAEYETVEEARNGALNELLTLRSLQATAPADRWKYLGSFIFKTSQDFTNTPKAKIVQDGLNHDFIDFRFKDLKKTNVDEHGILTGLSLDTHLQYALLEGRQGDVLNIDFIKGRGQDEVYFQNNILKSVKNGVDPSDATNRWYVDKEISNIDASLNYMASLYYDKTHIDASFAALDSSINDLYEVKAAVIEVSTYNAIQDASIKFILDNYATTNSVDTKLFNRDTSIQILYETKASIEDVSLYNYIQDVSIALKSDLTYVDGSLLIRDNSISYLYEQEYLRESSLGTDFYWNGNVIDLSTAFKNKIDNAATGGYEPFYFKDLGLTTNYLRNLVSQNGLIITTDGSTSILDSSIYVPGIYTYTGQSYSGNLNFHIPFSYFQIKLVGNKVSNITSFESASGVTQVAPYDASAELQGNFFPWGTSSWDPSGNSSIIELTDWTVFYRSYGENITSSFTLDVSNLSNGTYAVYFDADTVPPVLSIESELDRRSYAEKAYIGHVGVGNGLVKVWHESPDLFGTPSITRDQNSLNLVIADGLELYVNDASTIGFTPGAYFNEGADFRSVDFYNNTFTGKSQNLQELDGGAPATIFEVDASHGYATLTPSPYQDFRTYSNRYWDSTSESYIDSSINGKFILSGIYVLDQLDGIRILIRRGFIYDSIDDAIAAIDDFETTATPITSILKQIHPLIAYTINQTDISSLENSNEFDIQIPTGGTASGGGGGTGGVVGATNIGTGIGSYSSLVNSLLQFKSFKSNTSEILLSQTSDTILFDTSIKNYDPSINQLFSTKADITYVDSSLQQRDVSIKWLQDNTVSAQAINDYVDPSLAERDASIKWLQDNTYTRTYLDGSLNVKTNFNYVDGSLALRDASINKLFSDKINGTGSSATYKQVAFWNSAKEIDNDNLFIWDSTSNKLAIGSNGFTSGDEETIRVNSGVTTRPTVARFEGTINDYLQLEVINQSNSNNASSNIVASVLGSTDDIGYINMGINSETYNLNYIGTAYDAYLYSIAANLIIANASLGQDIIMSTNSDDVYANERLRITSDGSILIGKPTSINNLLEVNGDINLPTGANYKINEIPLYSNTYIDGSLNAKLSADAAGTLATIQIERTTDFTATTSWQDITFDQIVVQTDASSIYRDDANTNRIYLVNDGTYFISTKVLPTNATSQRYDIRLYKNDAAVVTGSGSWIDIYSGETHELTINTSFDASAGDYVSLQGLAEVGGTFQANTSMTLYKLDGIKGKDGTDGQPGPAGSGSTINVSDEGTPLSGPFDEINFIGSTVTASADGSTANITISGTVYGSEYQIASSTGVSSTTATTPQTKVTLTTSDLPYGNYKVSIHWMANRSAVTSNGLFDMTLNGTPQGVTSTIDKEFKDVTNWESLSRSYFLTLSGINTLAFRYWAEASTTSVSDVHIELIRVS